MPYPGTCPDRFAQPPGSGLHRSVTNVLHDHDAGLVLRPFAGADVPRLLEVFQDPDIVAWNPGPPDVEQVTAWAEGRNDWSGGTHVSWAVGDAAGDLLGSVSLHHLDLDQRDAEVGYWVSPWARRRGVAVRAVRLALSYAFGELDLHRVYLYHSVENTASCRVAARAGFRHEGTLLQSFRYADGRYHDEHLHARLAAEPAAAE